jgi:hypothetical protein
VIAVLGVTGKLGPGQPLMPTRPCRALRCLCPTGPWHFSAGWLDRAPRPTSANVGELGSIPAPQVSLPASQQARSKRQPTASWSRRAARRRRLLDAGVYAPWPTRRVPGASIALFASKTQKPNSHREMVQVVVHHLDQARAALAAAVELGCALELRSAPAAAGYAGVGYLKALGAELGQELLIDCGDDAGLVMAALRTGCRRIAFSGTAEQGRRLTEMAEQLGATVIVEAQVPEVVMLQPEDDAAAVLRACACGAQ